MADPPQDLDGNTPLVKLCLSPNGIESHVAFGMFFFEHSGAMAKQQRAFYILVVCVGLVLTGFLYSNEAVRFIYPWAPWIVGPVVAIAGMLRLKSTIRDKAAQWFRKMYEDNNDPFKNGACELTLTKAAITETGVGGTMSFPLASIRYVGGDPEHIFIFRGTTQVGFFVPRSSFESKAQEAEFLRILLSESSATEWPGIRS